MMKKIVVPLVLAVVLIVSSGVIQQAIGMNETDFDPLVDVEVTFNLKTVRWLEEPLSSRESLINNVNILTFLIEEIRGTSISTAYSALNKVQVNPYVRVLINGVEFVSPIWENSYYINNPQWTATLNVADDQEYVDILVQLWNHQDDSPDVLLDLNSQPGVKQARLSYSIATGHWTGDDELKDDSGYGRLSGCDDESIYTRDDDAEIWFDISQNDFDGDGIPYWIEVNNYGTDPENNDIHSDEDNDFIPAYWEHVWGYDPLVFEDHKTLDDDADSLTNYEEYLTSEWYSDPFRKDVFVEQDIMDEGPNGEISHFSDRSGELIRTAFNRQNIVFHLDNGSMGGQDIIPFQANVNRDDLNDIYETYFLHGDKDNWRRGVFHYGVVVYSSVSAAGYMYRANAFQISAAGHDSLVRNNPDYEEDIVYASAYMHELGHTFGYWPIPGHNRISGIPGIIDYVRTLPYKSCMNYGYMYIMVDYSDGSRMPPDRDDWDEDRMNLFFFENEW